MGKKILVSPEDTSDFFSRPGPPRRRKLVTKRLFHNPPPGLRIGFTPRKVTRRLAMTHCPASVNRGNNLIFRFV
jgi:hypothetical protein